MVHQFQVAFKVDMTAEVQMLMDVTDQLDKILFDDYIKRKAANVAKIIRKGVLGGTVDWYEAPKPTGQPYSRSSRKYLTTLFVQRYTRSSTTHFYRSFSFMQRSRQQLVHSSLVLWAVSSRSWRRNPLTHSARSSDLEWAECYRFVFVLSSQPEYA